MFFHIPRHQGMLLSLGFLTTLLHWYNIDLITLQKLRLPATLMDEWQIIGLKVILHVKCGWLCDIVLFNYRMYILFQFVSAKYKEEVVSNKINNNEDLFMNLNELELIFIVFLWCKKNIRQLITLAVLFRSLI